MSALVVFTLSASGVLEIARVEPQTAFGFGVFKWQYHSTSDKAAFLRRYDQALADCNGSYVPDRVDRFLIDRIEQGASDREAQAIAEFYAKKGGQRTPRGIVAASERVKLALVSRALDLDGTFGEWHRVRALIFIDEMRLSRTHYKASINFRSGPDLAVIKKDWLTERVLGRARKEFLDWWNLDLAWEEKCRIDPLVDTPLEISGP